METMPLIVPAAITGMLAFLVGTKLGVEATWALSWNIDQRRERGLPVGGRRVALWCMVLLFAYALIPLAVMNGPMARLMAKLGDMDCM